MNDGKQIGQTFAAVVPFRWVKFTLTGIEAKRKPTYSEWVAAGASIATVRRCSHFWLGDWVNIGESAFGEKYAQALEESDFDYRTLVNDAYVCRKVTLKVRREDLTFGHHAEVASLPLTEQRRLLAMAAHRTMTVGDLRKVVNQFKGKTPMAVTSERQIAIAIAAAEKALSDLTLPAKVVAELKEAHMHLTRAKLALAPKEVTGHDNGTTPKEGP